MWGKDQKTVGTSVQSEVNHNDIQHFFRPPSGSFKKKQILPWIAKPKLKTS